MSGTPIPSAGEGFAASRVTLPTGRIALSVIAVGAGVVAVGWPIAQMLRQSAVSGVWLGGPMAAAIVGLGVMATRPWRARVVAQWPMALFGVQGATLVGVGLAGAGVYTTQHPDPMGFAASMVAGFVGGWVVVARIVSRALAPPG